MDKKTWGVYLTKETMDIFDKLENKKYSYADIIYALLANMNRSGYTERITLGFPTMNVDNLKKVFGSKFKDDDLLDFVRNYKLEYRKMKDDFESTKVTKPIKIEKNDIEDMASNRKDNSKKVIRFTEDFWMVLDKLQLDTHDRSGKISDICWSLYELEGNKSIDNKPGFEVIDISDKYGSLFVTRQGRESHIKISNFIKYFFKNKFSDADINKFCFQYDKIINGASSRVANYHKPREFKFDPMDVKETFISLVTETYPHGHEEEVVPYLPKDLSRDSFGNYYKVIGNSDTAFTCHLDTASRTKSKINLVIYENEGDEFIKSDGTTILGADDKSGVAIMMYMMANKVPGVYWFFYGEERGGIGSGKVADAYHTYPFMKDIKKMVSFDRRNYYSVITEQSRGVCCSNEFAASLCDELNKSGLKLNLDPTGVFTDSANFVDYIPECTNVSVGYFNEHTHDEVQNLTYLKRLAEACVKCDWDKLVIKRKIGFDEEVVKKYGPIIKDLKRMIFYNTDSAYADDYGRLVIDLEIDDSSIPHMYRDFTLLEELFDKHKVDPDVNFDEEHIKIIFE